jgi:hypothetical protein
MFEFKASELKGNDEFTVTGGETWWRVLSNDRENARTRRIFSECVYSQVSDVKVGDQESTTLANDAPVIVR